MCDATCLARAQVCRESRADGADRHVRHSRRRSDAREIMPDVVTHTTHHTPPVTLPEHGPRGAS